LALVVSFVADINLSQPGRWHLIPDPIGLLIFFLPLACAAVAVLLAIAGVLRGDPSARAPQTWRLAGIIVSIYLLFWLLGPDHVT